ncbi:P-loop NTPase fold protein [Actinoplanes sp. N902-109]|uniref:P-loop NTPase fold protein n=1 Tax=Actinoplanes sp. (strain N902-109) TaxID=649831 RepID=UPI00032961FF|nr:P-loop NTPase fold protein [Actinoplanes sp. N902-109]AGL14219.1 hypothetical protein L083_0709 [Actinoplanes sp. N902-109]
MTGGGAAWWVDDPIESSEHDQLGRLPFVRRVVAMLDEVRSHPNSTVMALVGPWGSGKTSTINLVLDALGTERWAVARLNPWAMGSSESIAAELLAAIGTALPSTPKAKRAREKLKEYAVQATPLLALVPTVGESLKGVGDLLAGRLQGDTTLYGK